MVDTESKFPSVITDVTSNNLTFVAAVTLLEYVLVLMIVNILAFVRLLKPHTAYELLQIGVLNVYLMVNCYTD